MVGIVVVSHSARLAEGVAELAREMGGEDVRIEPAGGLAEPEGAIGTDATLVAEAIERARGPDGVLVLMDLGSALMSAEMAVELGGADGVRLSEAPLVEGAVAAAAAARGGASLDEVAAEARGALAPKAAQLGAEAPGAAAPAPPAEPGPEEEAEIVRLEVDNPLGLHARPAARFVATAGRFDARLAVVNATTGAGPASARSLTALATLGVRQGHRIEVRATGPQAAEALAALRRLAGEHFGDAPEAAPPPPARGDGAPPAPPAGAAAPEGPPAPGTRVRGIAASPGIASGPARHLRPPELEVPAEPSGAPAAEWERLEEARAAARRDVARDRDAVAGRAGAAEAAIFEAHLLVLDDDALIEPTRHAVLEEGASAGRAWQDAFEAAARGLEALDDELLRARATDVRDVGRRVLGHLLGAPGTPALAEPGVLVAGELTPAETAALDRDLVRGIATARGTATSHAAILARAIGIPAVVGAGDALLAVPDGTPLALDGERGEVLVDPPEREREDYERRRAEAERRHAAARARAARPALTRDGVAVHVEANLGAPGEAAAAVAAGAEGVGLLRSEFLFLDRAELPDEAEQAAAYGEIAAALEGRPLVVRTLDAGADKPLAALPQPAEANPFLGRRGIRLALAEPEVLRVQLRALVRAAAEHPGIRVMLPMVATLGEVRAARAMLDAAAAELAAGRAPELGIMVEVPAAAVAADRFAPEVAFFSIGTNDLAQYTMAAERGNERVAELAEGPVPAVLRLVAQVTRAAAAHGRPVAVCGELAGDPAGAALLAGLGVRALSMAPARIPEVKDVVRGMEMAAAERAARAALDRDTAAEARELAAPLLAAGGAGGDG